MRNEEPPAPFRRAPHALQLCGNRTAPIFCGLRNKEPSNVPSAPLPRNFVTPKLGDPIDPVTHPKPRSEGENEKGGIWGGRGTAGNRHCDSASAYHLGGQGGMTPVTFCRQVRESRQPLVEDMHLRRSMEGGAITVRKRPGDPLRSGDVEGG